KKVAKFQDRKCEEV
ncbi:hypothetical protein, partial [Bacillus paranthracis]